MFYENAQAHYKQLQQEAENLSSQIQHFPRGTLHCSKVHQYTKWYRSENGKQIYISKNDTDQLESLASKKYALLKQAEIIQEMKALELYLNQFSPTHNADKLLSSDSLYKPFLSSQYSIESEELLSWVTSDYEKNPNYPENLIYKTFSGNYVRSKSEVIIDMALTQKKIPFRYECKLTLGDTVFYPDFTILHPIKKKIFYWEHFGKIKDPKYLNNTLSKLGIFAANDILPTINLITTYETPEYPLNLDYVNALIDFYFLTP